MTAHPLPLQTREFKRERIMLARITTTIDGRETTTEETAEWGIAASEMACRLYDTLCIVHDAAGTIHVAVTTWADSAEEDQETAECGWK